jgi:hypothetical protein
LTNVVTFSTTTYKTISTGSNIEFWTLDSEMSVLDSAITGGTWNTSTRVGALGINPEDITIDGDGFITPNTSHAPEELVPGEINESLGINVYTKNSRGGPVVLSSYINIVAGTTTTYTLGIVPPSVDNIMVTFNNNIFTYITGTNFTTSTYTINWATNQIIIPPQTVSGNLGYTIVSIGGGRSDKEAGVIDSASISMSGVSTVQVQSLSSYQTIKSAYVTLNGQKVESTGTGVYYQLTYANSINRRAAVNVYNLPIDKTNTVTAWFFGTFNKYFNEVREETFPITSSTYYTLSYPPGNIEPVAEEAIVELYDPATGRRNILRPPYVDYYKVLNAYSTTFTINNTGTYSLGSRLRVYVNGAELKPGFEYGVVNGTQVSINFGICQVNDVVAILSKPTIPNYDYDITGNVLSLEPGFPIGKQIKVITYNNHDDMFIRTEQFIGLAGRRYQISRPALNSNYVWVIVNGIPLVNILDYEILDDLVTVQISSRFEHTASDKITIISISDSPLATTVLGYRVFNDIFNRTHFKRLSKQNTTYLTQPLSFTDTEIHVADAGVLTPPLVAKNMPGVVIIDGERIEFFTVANNTLGQLRRSTLGTAPSFYSEENTKVIDQGLDQTVPYKENIYKQVLLTSTSTNTYSISAIDYVVNTGTFHQFMNNGITFTDRISAVDQVEVNYGGRRLSKAGTFHQDIAMSYDSPQLKYQGTITSVSLLPATTIIGTGYVLTDTKQVWVYEDSNELESVNGYVYRGLDYRDPEFTIDLICTTSTMVTTTSTLYATTTSVTIPSVPKILNTYTGVSRTYPNSDSNYGPGNLTTYTPSGPIMLMGKKYISSVNGGPLEVVFGKTTSASVSEVGYIVFTDWDVTFNVVNNYYQSLKTSVETTATYLQIVNRENDNPYSVVYKVDNVQRRENAPSRTGPGDDTYFWGLDVTFIGGIISIPDQPLWAGYENNADTGCECQCHPVSTLNVETPLNVDIGWSTDLINSSVDITSSTAILSTATSISTVTTFDQQIKLNIENGVQEGVKLTLVKREIPFVWNDIISSESTKSLVESKSTQARFLQSRPAELPDKYYYGGDPILSENDGYAITTHEGQPLEGY